MVPQAGSLPPLNGYKKKSYHFNKCIIYGDDNDDDSNIELTCHELASVALVEQFSSSQ